jgi:predicted HD phosphohydrolase
MSSPLDTLTSLYQSSGQHHYGATQSGSALPVGDGPTGVSFLSHALQCAAAAAQHSPSDDELIAAALLHDVGWLLPCPASGSQLTSAAAGAPGSEAAVFIARHDVTGSEYLSRLGFPARVCTLVAGHVSAKRYLVATEPAYAASLSPGSQWTLAQQGGPFSPQEAAAFAATPDAQLCLALRRWDEAAKAPGPQPHLAPWEAHLPRLARVLASALWLPLASPALPPTLRLPAIAPQAHTSPLSPAGPGYAVLRAWLSPLELAAIRSYACTVVPSLPGGSPSQAFHTYERTLAGQVVHSRTEHFAHLQDAGGVGRFLAQGRLAELCSALREGRPFSLYKEKLNYKLAGGGGGYLPHVDFYHAVNPATLQREGLLSDSDVCVCMLAVDDMDEGNGCPYVAPGCHAQGPVFFKGATGSLGEASFDRAEVAALPLLDAADLAWVPVRLAAGDV